MNTDQPPYCRKCLCETCVCGEPNFYCQIKCGEVGFSIEEWNESYKELEKLPLTEAEKDAILHPEPCKVQCDACINIVLDRRLSRK